jgi:hypothetical protein
MAHHLLSTDQEMIPPSNAVDARLPYFVFNDELLLSLLKQFSHRALTARYFKCLMF